VYNSAHATNTLGAQLRSAAVVIPASLKASRTCNLRNLKIQAAVHNGAARGTSLGIGGCILSNQRNRDPMCEWYSRQSGSLNKDRRRDVPWRRNT